MKSVESMSLQDFKITTVYSFTKPKWLLFKTDINIQSTKKVERKTWLHTQMHAYRHTQIYTCRGTLQTPVALKLPTHLHNMFLLDGGFPCFAKIHLNFFFHTHTHPHMHDQVMKRWAWVILRSEVNWLRAGGLTALGL